MAISADGSRIITGVGGGRIWLSVGTTTPGSTGGISGDRDAAAQLQYLGNGLFRVLSHEGTLNPF